MSDKLITLFKKNSANEVATKLHKRTEWNITLLNDCSSLFDQFERLSPSKIISNAPTNHVNDASASWTSHKIN